ncbi:MAG TPA: TlpA disulfide reductase family protein [Flavobacteriaceae bacterium]|nr:TlpA disulfide reductase family protein [Flavobacteriaceae bacterium]
MKKKLKKELVQWAAIGGVFLVLFLTGLHTEVFGFLQGGILATGIITPDIEEQAEANATQADLNVPLLNSKGESLNMREFEGKVVFMNVWATWCAPCVAEMPGINNLYNDIQDENIEFVMLSVDDQFEKAVAFKTRKNFDFEVYRSAGNFPEMYQTSTIPTTYIIDAEGNLVLEHKGMANYHSDEFKNFLRKLM